MKNKIMYIITGVVIFLLLMMTQGCLVSSTTSTTNVGTIRFLVTDSDGKFMQGAKVVSDLQPEGQPKLTGLTEADGTVVFQNIRPGDYDFYINRFDYNQTQIAFTAINGRIADVPVKLTPTSSSVTTPALPIEITFAELTSDPDLYNGKTVTMTGYWFDGFEIEVLAERLEPSSFAPGNVQPAGVKIWIRNGLPVNISAQLYVQPKNATGYPAHYGKVEITGILEYGSQYGHLNAYQYQLNAQTAQYIPWAP